jgi:hypothetical protein
MSLCRSISSAFICALSGPIEPSPKTSSVTPCFSSPSDRPSAISDRSEWLSMLMKPGATTKPVASTTVGAFAFDSCPTAAIRSPWMATSLITPGDPLPSTIVPPRMMTS